MVNYTPQVVTGAFDPMNTIEYLVSSQNSSASGNQRFSNGMPPLMIRFHCKTSIFRGFSHLSLGDINYSLTIINHD